MRFTIYSGLDCDININSPLGCRNSELLGLYCKISPRFKQVGFVVKHMAKLADMNDASQGMLSSYALIMMVLHYMQQLEPPVVPYLQELECGGGGPRDPHLVSGWDTYFFDNLELLPQVWRDENTSSVGELLIGFVRYYTEVFDWGKEVVCVRRAGPLTKAEKLWEDRDMCMEDPFDLNHNLSRGVGKSGARFILENLRQFRSHLTQPIPATVASPSSSSSTGRHGVGGGGHRTKEAHYSDYFFNAESLSAGSRPDSRKCRNCGAMGHYAKECPKQVCFNCGRQGHRRADCPLRGQGGGGGGGGGRRRGGGGGGGGGARGGRRRRGGGGRGGR